MKAFKFKLQTLLKLREASRERALLDYAKSIHERQQIEANLKKAIAHVYSLENFVGDKQKTNFRANDLTSLIGSIEDARNKVESLSTDLSQQKTIEESRRKIFLTKNTDSESLQNLKDRQTSEHIDLETKKEERELDDIIGARYLFDRVNPVM